MDPRFVLPISTMLAGLVLWLAYLIARAVSSTVKGWPTQVETAVTAAAGGLIVFSGFD